MLSFVHAMLAGMANPPVVDFSLTRQPIDGFGTSLCWWAVGVGGWSNDTAFDTFMDLLFADPKSAGGGLGLNQVRYNIGGSDLRAGDAHFLRPGGFVQTFEPEDGVYDWDADRTQRRVAAAAVQRGVQFVQGFVNSPPWWMTVSGSVTGNKDGAKDNLRADMFSTFAEHCATVVAHFASKSNLSFDTVTPLNEPISSWWKRGNDQEGCHFDRSSQSKIVQLLGDALQARGLGVGVSGPEENAVGDSVRSIEALGPAALARLSLVTTHTYNAAAGDRQALSKLASAHGKRLWASEYGDGDVSGVTLARRITLDLNELNLSVWTLWQAADLDNSLGVTSGWGLTAATYCGCEYGASCECKAACAARVDTWRPSWSTDPHGACLQWSTNSDWGALAQNKTIAEACKAWGGEHCAQTCCEATAATAARDGGGAADGAAARSVRGGGGAYGGAFAIRKSFWVYKQFTAHLRPGSTLVAPPAGRGSPAGRGGGGGWAGGPQEAPSLLTALDPRGRPVLIYTNGGAASDSAPPPAPPAFSAERRHIAASSPLRVTSSCSRTTRSSRVEACAITVEFVARSSDSSALAASTCDRRCLLSDDQVTF